MDDPTREITPIIYKLTTGSPRLQQQTLEHYFTPNASFSHPFCAVNGNRDHILSIFRWYKIMSPRIDIQVNGIAYESHRQKLYIDISQTFRIWPLIPLGYAANVHLTTILQLTRDPGGQNPSSEHSTSSSAFTPSGVSKPLPFQQPPGKFWIKSQTDLYQTTEFPKFASLLGLLPLLVTLWQSLATYACVLLAFVFAPFTQLMQTYTDQQVEHRAQVQTSPAWGPGGTTTTERQKALDVWEAEAKFLGAGEGDVGKMEGLNLKMKMKYEGRHDGAGSSEKDSVLDFMKMEKGGGVR